MNICRLVLWAVLVLLVFPAVGLPQDIALWLDDREATEFVPMESFGHAPGLTEWVVEEPMVWPGASAPWMMPPDFGPRPVANCPPWRPCGPANSFGANWLFYQGAYGADFRAACQNHDDCLLNPWNSRKGCDRAFLNAMAAECANTPYPGLCMLKAQKYYVGVRAFGGFVRYGAP